MASLNVRNVESIHLQRWKVSAARAGVTLRQWVMEKLNGEWVEQVGEHGYDGCGESSAVPGEPVQEGE